MRLETAVATDRIDTREFISALGPSICQGKVEEALFQVRNRWTLPQIVGLLGDKCADVRKVAAFAMSLVGDRHVVPHLALALHDGDVMVVEMAEHALWSIWFRLGNSRAVALVKCGSNHLHHGNFVSAVEKFTEAIEADPTFAEAYNQRAMAFYLSERFVEAAADCKAALARMPQHFGAMSGLGNCHAHRSEWRQARHCYRLSLAIHPRLEGIQASLDEIAQLLRENPELDAG